MKCLEKNEIKINKGVHKDKHVITIEGEVEDVNNINFKIQGNLKYSKFFFQIIFNKYHNLEESPDNKIKTKYNLAKIFEEEKKIIKDEELGIYQIKFPIKFVNMRNN